MFQEVCGDIILNSRDKYSLQGCQLLRDLQHWNPRNWTLNQPNFRSNPTIFSGTNPRNIPGRSGDPILFYPFMEQRETTDDAQATKRVCFYKLFKVGGSTFMSILHRLSWFHGLWTAFLPKKGYDVSLLIRKAASTNSKFDLSPMHFFFSERNQDLIHSIVPDCEDVTILRDPIARFISNFYFFSKVKTVEKLEADLEATKKLAKTMQSSVFNGIAYGLTNRIDSQYLMSLEYNMTLELLRATTPKDFVYNSNKKRKPFKHVMILEYFDEGLVMLMRDFHWSFYDIAYQVMKKNKGFPLPSEESMRYIKESHKLDYVLYDAAVETFLKNLDRQGQDYFDDLHTFKAFNHVLSEYCSLEFSRNQLGSFCLEISLDQQPWMRAHRIPSYGMIG